MQRTNKLTPQDSEDRDTSNIVYLEKQNDNRRRIGGDGGGVCIDIGGFGDGFASNSISLHIAEDPKKSKAPASKAKKDTSKTRREKSRTAVNRI